MQISYAIGVAQPTSVMITTFGTGKVPDAKIEQLVRKHFDLRPYAITKMLDLLHPMYQWTAAYGHFGRTPAKATYEWEDSANGTGKKTKKKETFTTFTWERTDKADALRADAGLKAKRK